MILALRKKQLLSLLLLYIASLFCPGTLRAEAMPLMNSKRLEAWDSLAWCPRANEMWVHNSFWGSKGTFCPFLASIHKKIVHIGSYASENFKNLLINFENLLSVDISGFFLFFLRKSVENGAIFLVAVFVIYSPLFRGEREVEK